MITCTFSIDNFKSYLKHKRQEIKNEPYLIVGFNEWVDDSKLIKIYPGNEEEMGKKYTIQGTIPKSAENLKYATDVMPFILMQYFIIQSNSHKLECSQRAGKSFVIPVRKVINEAETVIVHMKNKLKYTVCEFAFTIHSFESTHVTSTEREAKVNDQLAKYHQEYIDVMCETFKDTFAYFFKDTEHMFVFNDFNFQGLRPLSSYLYIRMQMSNEEYWIKMFNTCMLFYKSEMNIDLTTENMDVWKKMNISDQLSILWDMVAICSTNGVYLGDFVELKDGRMKSVEDFSTINENSGDCEDFGQFIYYCFYMFQSHGPYNYAPLFKLHKLSFLYLFFLCLDCVNRPSMGDNGKKRSDRTAHANCFSILKAFLYPRLIKNEGNRGEIENFIKEEHSHGYVKLETDEFEKVEKLPVAFVHEGTASLKSNGEKPCSTEVLRHLSDLKWLKPFKKRLYQPKDNNDVFLIHTLIGITNYFLDHNLNIPTVAFTYDPAYNEQVDCQFSDNGYIYGVYYSDLMKGNENIRFLPLHEYPHFHETIRCAIVSARNQRFPYQPLFVNKQDGSFESRTENANVKYPPPKINTKDLKFLFEKFSEWMVEPKVSNNVTYYMVSPEEMFVCYKTLDMSRISYIQYIEVHGDNSFFLLFVTNMAMTTMTMKKPPMLIQKSNLIEGKREHEDDESVSFKEKKYVIEELYDLKFSFNQIFPTIKDNNGNLILDINKIESTEFKNQQLENLERFYGNVTEITYLSSGVEGFVFILNRNNVKTICKISNDKDFKFEISNYIMLESLNLRRMISISRIKNIVGYLEHDTLLNFINQRSNKKVKRILDFKSTYAKSYSDEPYFIFEISLLSGTGYPNATDEKFDEDLFGFGYLFNRFSLYKNLSCEIGDDSPQNWGFINTKNYTAYHIGPSTVYLFPPSPRFVKFDLSFFHCFNSELIEKLKLNTKYLFTLRVNESNIEEDSEFKKIVEISQKGFLTNKDLVKFKDFQDIEFKHIKFDDIPEYFKKKYAKYLPDPREKGFVGDHLDGIPVDHFYSDYHDFVITTNPPLPIENKFISNLIGVNLSMKILARKEPPSSTDKDTEALQQQPSLKMKTNVEISNFKSETKALTNGDYLNIEDVQHFIDNVAQYKLEDLVKLLAGMVTQDHLKACSLLKSKKGYLKIAEGQSGVVFTYEDIHDIAIKKIEFNITNVNFSYQKRISIPEDNIHELLMASIFSSYRTRKDGVFSLNTIFYTGFLSCPVVDMKTNIYLPTTNVKYEGYIFMEKITTTLYRLFVDEFSKDVIPQNATLIFKSVMFQLIYTLFFMQTQNKFIDFDLHINNVFLKFDIKTESSDKPYIVYKYKDMKWVIDNTHWFLKMGDYDRSYADYNGITLESDATSSTISKRYNMDFKFITFERFHEFDILYVLISIIQTGIIDEIKDVKIHDECYLFFNSLLLEVFHILGIESKAGNILQIQDEFKSKIGCFDSAGFFGPNKYYMRTDILLPLMNSRVFNEFKINRFTKKLKDGFVMANLE